jgi:hypothetical protein
LLDNPSLPGGARVWRAKQSLHIADTKESMQDAAVARVDFARFLLEVCVIGRELSGAERVAQNIEALRNGCPPSSGLATFGSSPQWQNGPPPDPAACSLGSDRL